MNVHASDLTGQAINATITAPVIIIGSGFGGILTAIELRKAGHSDFIMLERAGDVGGVWRDNSYPGAACDVVSRFYSISFEQGYPWSDAFAPRGEIIDYIHQVVEKHDIRRHVTFNTEVRAAHFDEACSEWILETSTGITYRTPILISAVGLFNQPSIPNIQGREDFKGAQFHSARWRHDIDLTGKSVAIIGNGASCVQFLPKVAAQAGALQLFQRTPQYVMPKAIFPGASEFDIKLGKKPALRWLARLRVYLMFERFIFRRIWQPHLRLQGEAAFHKLLAEKVKDPDLRRKLTPDYPMGCKRQLVSNEWYDALVRPHVEVVDTPIESLTADGVRTRDGKVRKADVVIYGTGFKPTEFLQPMRITGAKGLELNTAWRDGAEAHLGIAVAGFPNFFMLYGPNTNAASSIIFMLECQARYIVDAVRTLSLRKARTMTVRADAQQRFIADTNARLSRTIPARADCRTYFKQANGRITTNWPGYAFEYRWRTRRVRAGDFDFA